MFGNFFKDKKILVTGHTGFQGSWLTLWLKLLDANVIGYSLPPPTKPSLFESLEIEKESKLLEGVDNGSWVYFVHSYRAKPLDQQIVVANADYGINVPAVVENGIYFGTQFHPEKSGKIGSLMIRNFLKECKQ